jgi:Fe-Mn family superoxide dismutase
MKVSFNYENKDFKKHSDFVNKFVKLLQREFPLKTDLKIYFLNQKKGEMSTGSRRGDNVIKVLVGDRMNRDIMRTLAHEWVHEYQMDVLKREHGPNIGGQNEDEANAFAGRIVKIFEKENPDYEPKMYEGKGIEKRINILNEEILISEKTSIKESLLVEMKTIGVEKLPYSYSSLSRFIDTKTMNVHYKKHYKGYVDKLNKALKDKDGDMTLEEIIRSISKFNNVVRNNAGGAFNHALFWKMLSPKKQRPHGEVYEKIKKDFGNIKKMKDEFNQAAKDRFGSGWSWLYLTKEGKLKIMSLPNQDNPLMNIVKKGGYPILGLDVWEHAYYLKYQNKRDEYIQKFWDVVNWDFVNQLYLSKVKTKKKLNESHLKFLLENEETNMGLKQTIEKELQKIRLIPLDMESANVAINNIITAEIERGNLNFNRTINGLMTLDLNTISERSRFRFNNYYKRFYKSRVRGFEFEGLISGLLGGTISEGLNTPYDIITPQSEKISCKIIRDLNESVVLKGVNYSLGEYINNYTGSDENKKELILMSNTPNPISYLINSTNQDFKNIAEDLIDYLLKDVDGMLLGIPQEDFKIVLFYYDKEKLKNIIKTPGMTVNPKTKGSKQIRFSTKVLKLTDSDTAPTKGSIKFPTISDEEYTSFLLGDEKTKEILDLFNQLGLQYGVSKLGDNIPQDIINKLSKNDRFKMDIQQVLK